MVVIATSHQSLVTLVVGNGIEEVHLQEGRPMRTLRPVGGRNALQVRIPRRRAEVKKDNGFIIQSTTKA